MVLAAVQGNLLLSFCWEVASVLAVHFTSFSGNISCVQIYHNAEQFDGLPTDNDQKNLLSSQEIDYILSAIAVYSINQIMQFLATLPVAVDACHSLKLHWVLLVLISCPDILKL